MPREPEAKDKCPVCDGTGKAFDPWLGVRTDKPCLACDGTGFPPWSNKFKELVEQGIIHTPQRPKATAEQGLPAHVAAAQNTDGYDGYVRKIKKAGFEPYQHDLIKAMMRRYREAGHTGLDWNNSWSTELDNLISMSKSYGHFVWLVQDFNSRHRQSLALKGPYAAENRAAKLGVEWIAGSYTLIMLDKPNTVNHIKSFRFITINIIKGNQYHQSEWCIYNNNTGDMMGTTFNLKDFLHRTGFVVKARVTDYVAWLQERKDHVS